MTETMGPLEVNRAERFRPYPQYQDSGVQWLGEIPVHWTAKRLKFLAPTRVGKLDTKPDDAIYVGLEHVESWTGRLLLQPQPEDVESVVSSFAAGDVLLGKLRPYLAKAARPDFDGVCSSEILTLRPGSGCSPSYLTYCLLNAPYVRWLDSLTYGAKMPRVNAEQVGSSCLPLPPESEQRDIADFLDRETAKIDALVTKKERLIELLQEKRTALVTHAVTRGLDPNAAMKDSGIEWLGEIPAHWQVKKLSRLTKCLDGKRVPLNAEERGRMQGDYPYWGANSIVDYLDQWLFDEELVLLGEDGAPFFDKTRPVAFSVGGRIWVNNHAHVLRPLGTIDSRFLAHALNCVDYRAFIDGSTRDKLTQGAMRGIPVQCPAVQEQGAIAIYLDRETTGFEELISRIRKAIERLKELRTALISAAVTGKIDVREAAPR